MTIGYVPPPYSIFNPPTYYQAMENDVTQVPFQQYPYGGGPQSPMGPYAGFYVGQRPFENEDAIRDAQRRAKFTYDRAMTSDDPAHTYISPDGLLSPEIAKALANAAKYKRQQLSGAPESVGNNKKIVMLLTAAALVYLLLK